MATAVPFNKSTSLKGIQSSTCDTVKTVSDDSGSVPGAQDQGLTLQSVLPRSQVSSCLRNKTFPVCPLTKPHPTLRNLRPGGTRSLPGGSQGYTSGRSVGIPDELCFQVNAPLPIRLPASSLERQQKVGQVLGSLHMGALGGISGSWLWLWSWSHLGREPAHRIFCVPPPFL